MNETAIVVSRIVAALALDVAATRAEESTQSPERNLQAATEVLAEKFRVDWNSHDLDAMGQLLTADADFVNVIGMHMKGRAQIVARHKEVHKTQFKNSVWVTHSVEAQLLAPGFGLVHVNWGISGDLDPDGTPRQARDGIFSWLLIKQADGTWLIRSVQNTNIRALMVRLSSAIRGLCSRQPKRSPSKRHQVLDPIALFLRPKLKR